MSSLAAALVMPFNATAFTTFGAPTTWGEVLGFASGAWCVWLVGCGSSPTCRSTSTSR